MKKLILIVGILIGFVYGVNAYNDADLDKFLKTKSCPGGDLSEAHFVDLDLTEANLENANLRGVTLSYVTFDRSNFIGAKLNRLACYETSFWWASFIGADMTDVDFEYAKLVGPVFKNANILRGKFVKARFSTVDLTEIKDHKIDNWYCLNASFYKTNFSGLEISESHFGATRIEDCDFAKTKIIGCTFSGSDILRSRFGLAKIQDSNFASTKIKECDFAGASLLKSSFAGAKLLDTSFEGADLTQANIGTAEFTDVTMPDGKKYTGYGKDYKGPLRVEGNYSMKATSTDPVAKYLSEMSEPEKEKLRMVLMRQSELLDVDAYMIEDIIHNRKQLQKEGKDDSHLYDTNTIEIMDKLSKEIPSSNF